uniref:receptor-like protein kinase ANXUR2 n=1 Tax=Erigeron canadensis TaxID=72917 RepID=UPI001CB9B6DC|nr:receptor-like protein kinase ANXUR2 [Erigeron canadensis]
MLSSYKHENIVSLLGCDDLGEKILVYEYASKKSLDLYLNKGELTWIRRLQICLGAARGLACLHNAEGTYQRVLHRDIKSSNILLDESWKAKISDFGLSKFGSTNQENSFCISHAVGTPGYCDPAYAETGLLTKESDVYSFGVVLFEVLVGRLCFQNNDKHPSLARLARNSFEQNTLSDIVFVSIKDEINPSSLRVFGRIAYQCLNKDGELRPSMFETVRALETALRCQIGQNGDLHSQGV